MALSKDLPHQIDLPHLLLEFQTSLIVLILMNLHSRDGLHLQSFLKINVELVPLLTHYNLHANYDGKEEKWAAGKRMAAWSCYQWL